MDANGKATAGTEEKQYVELTVPAGKKTASVTIDGLVIGTYDITEADDSTYDADLTDYTLEVTGDETATVPYGGTGEAGITNTYTQDLPNVQVTKAFSGLTNLPDGFRITNDYDDTLVFTVGSAGMTGTGTTDDPYTWTIEKVPVDTVIVFTESGIQADGYILTVNGTVTSNATATASCFARPCAEVLNVSGTTFGQTSSPTDCSAETTGDAARLDMMKRNQEISSRPPSAFVGSKRKSVISPQQRQSAIS